MLCPENIQKSTNTKSRFFPCEKREKTHREIAESLGLEKEQIKKWLRRYRIKKEKIEAGIPIRTRGQHRKNSEPKNIIAEQAYEIQRLKMENDLLRDFLRFAERR